MAAADSPSSAADPCDASATWPRIYFAFWCGYFCWFWWNALRYDSAGNLIAGHPGLWADWALHFTLGNTMALRELLPATSPLLLDAPFAYPFAADLLSALLMRAGLPMLPAFVVPSLLSSLLLVFALYTFLRELLRSNRVAALGSTLFLLIGGTGFVRVATDALASADPLDALSFPARAATLVGVHGNEMLSIIESMVIPQRSFALGFPIALIALGSIHATMRKSAAGLTRRDWTVLLVASLLLGVLPVTHPHSFLAVFVILAFWSAGHVLFGVTGSPIGRVRPWLAIALVTSLVAVPLIARFIAGHVDAGFIRWSPGWNEARRDVAWLAFWFSAWSLTPLLASLELAAMVAGRDGRAERMRALFTFLPFFALFALANLFLFAPWWFDNTKVLAFAALGFSGLAARAILVLWDAGRAAPRGGVAALPARRATAATRFGRPVAVMLVVAVTASGAVDAWRVLRTDRRSHEMYSRQELELARWARDNTPAASVWLTGDRHLHWVTNLTGRQVVMAFRGWLGSHGYDYETTQRDIARMLATADPELLRKYRIDYVVIGPDETTAWRADVRAFERYPVVRRTPSTTVFRIE